MAMAIMSWLNQSIGINQATLGLIIIAKTKRGYGISAIASFYICQILFRSEPVVQFLRSHFVYQCAAVHYGSVVDIVLRELLAVERDACNVFVGL